MVRVENFVAGHHRHQILRFRQVDNVVRPAGNHVDSLNLIPGNLKLHRFPGVDIPFMNQAVTGDHNEKLPLGVVPVLPFGDTRAADVDAHLPTVGGMNQLGEGATVIHIHLESVLKPVRGQIAQVQGVQFLGEAAVSGILGIMRVLGCALNSCSRSTISPNVTLWVMGTQQ